MCKQMTDVKLLLLHNNTYIHLTVSKQMINSKSNYLCLIEILEIIYVQKKNEHRFFF